MPCISYWVISASEFVAFWSGMSSVRGSREITTPAAGGAFRGHALQLPGEVDDPLHRRVAVNHRAQLRGDLEASSSLMPSWFGTALAMRSTSPYEWPSTSDVADRGPGQHRAERDDLGDVVAAVLPGDVGDDLAPAVLEVDVDVGHRHPVGRNRSNGSW